MLELKNITKVYKTGYGEVHALKGINLKFRESEFVSILGESGCGKTTLLNIIGGLDRYTEGDLIINSKSTKDFKDRDWDSYRNYSIGFIFQSYNLIGHQSVLANVELALTISGVSKKERRKRAISALEEVGLKDKIHYKPNQLSGGQMQRVAIARALVNKFLKLSCNAVKNFIDVFLNFFVSFFAPHSSSSVNGFESSVIFPSKILIILFEYFSAKFPLCVTIIINLSLDIFFNISITCTLVFVSNAPVGSSAKIISGSFTNALAIATLCICPPDNWFGFLFIWFFNPTSSNAFIALCFLSFLEIPPIVKASSTLDKTV